MHWAESGMSILWLSRIGLPMSRVSSRASSVLCLSIRSAKRCITFLRSEGAMFDQLPFSNTSRAALTARSTSSLSPAETLLITLPVAGLMLSKVLPEADGTYLPLMKAWLRKFSPATCDLTDSSDKAADIAKTPDVGDRKTGENLASSHRPIKRSRVAPALRGGAPVSPADTG